MDDNDLKKLAKMGITSQNAQIKLVDNTCPLCHEMCGAMVQLNECANNIIICMNCLDNMYDTYHLNCPSDKSDILFVCVCCQMNISNYKIIENN